MIMRTRSLGVLALWWACSSCRLPAVTEKA